MSQKYGLIFDVDGVIADTEAINARASIQVFSDLLGIEGVKREDFEEGLGRGAEAYVQSAAKVHGVELSSAQITKATALRQTYFLQILMKEPLPPFPGVMELLHHGMEARDFRVGIATSGTREKSEAVLKSVGVPYSEFVYVNGDTVERKKPDPELFLQCAARMKVSADRCVVIEDAPNGVQAARAAACKCIAVTNSTSADKLKKADRIVTSLSQVQIDAIRRLIG